jgi:hypothetical protein
MFTKKCIKCGKRKFISKFNVNPLGIDGRSNICKPCILLDALKSKEREDEKVATCRSELFNGRRNVAIGYKSQYSY